MGWLALTLAVVAAVAVALPAPGMFVAMGLGIAAAGTGWVAFRRRGQPGRLAGAGAVTIGLVALLLAGIRYGLTLAVIDRLEQLIR